MRPHLFIVAIAVLVVIAPAYSQEKRTHLMAMAGGGWYNKEGEVDSDLALGFAVGYHASDQLSVELQIHKMPVWGDDYYFIFLGSRYRFLGADFFMTPSLGFHGGVLVPQGEKDDVNGAAGIGGMLLYETRWGIEFGPEVSSTAVFEGPHIAVWLNYRGVVRYNF